MFSTVYNIGIALTIITAVAVFACVFHAYYKDFKETTSKEKKQRKLKWYLGVLIAGAALIAGGQNYLKDTTYVQNLYRNWANFEGKPYILPAPDGVFGERGPFEYEKEN